MRANYHVSGWMSPEEFCVHYYDAHGWNRTLRMVSPGVSEPSEVTTTDELYDIGCAWATHDLAKALWYLRVCEIVWSEDNGQ
jgi:hypothetical protein